MASNTTYKRVFEVIPGTNLAKPTNKAKCSVTGNVKYEPIKDASPVPVQTVVNNNFPIIQQNSDMAQNGMPYAVLPTETALGGRGVAREETFSRKPNKLQWKIGLSNPTANDIEMVLFDGLTTLFQYFKLSAPVGLVVSGTYGTNTVAQMQNFGQQLAVDLHALWIQNTLAADGSSSTGFFDDGYLRESYGDLANNAPFDSQIPLETLLQPTDYIQNIRVTDGWRFQINPLAGLHLLLPAGEKINIVMDVSAAALSYGMVKASGMGATY